MGEEKKRRWINSQSAGLSRPPSKARWFVGKKKEKELDQSYSKAYQAGLAKKIVPPIEMSWEFSRRLRHEDSTRFDYDADPFDEYMDQYDSYSPADRLRHRH
ncbi:MAG: hypothetical protein AAGU12_00385 [Clostridiales bacterium]